MSLSPFRNNHKKVTVMSSDVATGDIPNLPNHPRLSLKLQILTPADLTFAIMTNATSEIFTKTNGIMCEIIKENRSTTSVKYLNWLVLPKKRSEKKGLSATF